MEFLRENGGIASRSITNFENKYSIVLPISYRKFLIQFNGGLTAKGSEVFLINEYQKSSIIDKFYGLNIKESSNIEFYLDNYYDIFPGGIIPIGEDPGGNYICLNANGNEDYGKIYFYDHEIDNENEDGTLNWNNLYLIANSFTEFLEKLH